MKFLPITYRIFTFAIANSCISPIQWKKERRPSQLRCDKHSVPDLGDGVPVLCIIPVLSRVNLVAQTATPLGQPITPDTATYPLQSKIVHS